MRAFQMLVAFGCLIQVGCNSSSAPLLSSSTNSSAIAPRQIAAQGRLLPASGIISLSSIPGDQIESILVRSGQLVAQGDVLVVMRSNRLRQVELEAAQTKLAEAKSQFKSKELEAQLALQATSLKVEQAKIALEQAEKQAELAASGDDQLKLLRDQIERLKRLRTNPQTRDMIGQSEVDVKEIELQRAQQLYKQTLLSSKQAVQNAELMVQSAQQAEDAAKENVELVENSMTIESLEKQIELLRLQLDQTQIIAPSDATVLSVNSTVGEMAGPTPILDIGDLSSMVCVAEVHEADIARLKVGDTAEMNSAALPRILTGSVVQIDPLVGTPAMKLPNPLARTDFRAVQVRIKIADEEQAIAAALVQLQVDVTISPSENSGSKAITTSL